MNRTSTVLNSNSKSGGRYSAVPSPTAVGFNTNSQYGPQANGASSGYDGSGSVEDLTMGLRGMSVNEDYNNQGSSYRPATNMPQAQPPPPARAPHVLQPHHRGLVLSCLLVSGSIPTFSPLPIITDKALPESLLAL